MHFMPSRVVWWAYWVGKVCGQKLAGVHITYMGWRQSSKNLDRCTRQNNQQQASSITLQVNAERLPTPKPLNFERLRKLANSTTLENHTCVPFCSGRSYAVDPPEKLWLVPPQESKAWRFFLILLDVTTPGCPFWFFNSSTSGLYAFFLLSHWHLGRVPGSTLYARARVANWGWPWVACFLSLATNERALPWLLADGEFVRFLVVWYL